MIASGLIARRRLRIIFSDAEGHWQQSSAQREYEIAVKMCRGENRWRSWEQLYPAAMNLTPPDACKISPTLWKFNFGCKAPGATVSIFPCQLIITPTFPVAYSRLMHFWSEGFGRIASLGIMFANFYTRWRMSLAMVWKLMDFPRNYWWIRDARLWIS